MIRLMRNDSVVRKYLQSTASRPAPIPLSIVIIYSDHPGLFLRASRSHAPSWPGQQFYILPRYYLTIPHFLLTPHPTHYPIPYLHMSPHDRPQTLPARASKRIQHFPMAAAAFHKLKPCAGSGRAPESHVLWLADTCAYSGTNRRSYDPTPYPAQRHPTGNQTMSVGIDRAWFQSCTKETVEPHRGRRLVMERVGRSGLSGVGAAVTRLRRKGTTVGRLCARMR